MIRRCLAGLFAFACWTGAAAIAAEKVDFDQGVDVHGVVDASPIQASNDSPAPEAPAKTYEVSSDRTVHAKGFIKKTVSTADWRSFRGLSVDIPNSLDLRPQLTEIENQGDCGSCWAFSLTATHRDGHAVSGDDPGRLSQEWLVDNSPEASGCDGGYFDSAQDFVAPKGQPLWSACPYTRGAGKCSADLQPAASIKAWHMIGTSDAGPTVQDIEAYMTSSGRPISIAIAAAAGDWENYRKGVYNGCKNGRLDHMINIVGWDNEGAAFDKNGNLPPGVGIWILRNSWGKSWGEQGYIRMKMTDPSGKRCNAVAQEGAYFDF